MSPPLSLPDAILLVEEQKLRLDAAWRAGQRRGNGFRAVAEEAGRVAIAIADRGGQLKFDGSDATLKLAGVRSSCTAGVIGACTNWLRAARAKVPA